MDFEEAYERFMQHHMARSKGERLRRLKEGHGHAEKMLLLKVWWPMFGHFDHLHPEFEVVDFNGTSRFLDMALLLKYAYVDLEVHGFGPHWEKISRWQYADNLDRDSALTIIGWKVINFSYDRVMQQPEKCQQIIRQLLGSLAAQWEHGAGLSSIEKDILRGAQCMNRQLLTPVSVGEKFKMNRKTSRKILQQLLEKGWLISAGNGKERVTKYRLSERGVPLL